MNDKICYCINPRCEKRVNPEDLLHCKNCGTELVIGDRYRLSKPLRSLENSYQTEVFEIHDGETKKVLKVLTNTNAQWIDLFKRQALVLQKLRHPGIPKVEPDGYFTFTPNNSSRTLHCLVMELIEGLTLEEWLTKFGPISQELALDWLKQLTEILEQLHNNKLFHRDIKLGNIMLRNSPPPSELDSSKTGQLALIDFGTVREMSGTYLAKIGGGREITATFSPGYTPIEQVEGKAVPQSDFYSLGRTFVYLLTGKHPFDLPFDDNTGKLNWRKQAPKMSLAFAQLIDDLMALFPGSRPQNAGIILQRIEEIKKNYPLTNLKAKTAENRWLFGINLVLLTMLLVTGAAWWEAKEQVRQIILEIGIEERKSTNF
ncbi:MAG: serine/threonine-protein kinase [Cyanobacteriota bacterium]|nr:serine/threonine-protein kinase [Cyanobacteriota bacterium]